MNYILSFFNKIKPLLIFFLFFFFAIIFTYPAILNLSTKLIGNGGDNYLNIIYQHIVEKKLIHFSYPLSPDNTLRYPVGFDFSRGYDMLIFSLTGGILSLFLNYVTAFNLSILLGFSLNGICSFLLFRYISKSKLIGIIGAVIYGYSFYVLSRGAGHFGHSTIAGFPLFIYALLKLRNEQKFKNFLFISVSLILIIFAFLQHLLMFALLVILNIPLLFLLFNNEVKNYINIFWTNKIKTLISLLIFLFFFILFMYPFVNAALTGKFEDGNRQSLAKDNIIYLQEYIFPNPFSQTLSAEIANSQTKASIENIVFIGWIEIILFIGFIILFPKSKIKYLVLINISVFFILSLGIRNPNLDIALPYFFLYKYFPFHYIPETGRFVIIYSLFTTLAAVLVLKSLSKKTIFLTVILFLIILERITNNYYLSPILQKPYTKVVKSMDTSAVLDLPVSLENSVYDNLSIVYNKNIVSGYIMWSADTPETRTFINQTNLKRFICDINSFDSNPNIYTQTKIIQENKDNKILIQDLKAKDIRTIVIHKNTPEDHSKFYFPECANARMQTSLLAPQILMPNPTTEKTTKVMSLFFPAIPTIGDTITFPYDGVFYLDGLYMHPDTWLPLHIYQNGKEVTEINKWKDRGDNNVTADPYISFTVKKGSKISFSFDKNNNTAYSIIQIWYRYIPTEKTEIKNKEINSLIKIYEDDDAAVFRIQ